jgi:CO/xanthine dehydrogenase FAD-binding subunit
MAVLYNYNQVFHPAGFSDFFSFWNKFPDAVPFAGGTSLIRGGSVVHPDRESGPVYRELPELPVNILSLEKIDELCRITRTERYLEIGAMVRLSEIIGLGKTVPDAFTETLKGIAGPQIRNLATIGGNLCVSGDAAALLAALEARYELRSAGGSRWVSALRFSSAMDGLKHQELLTRIRIPLDEWNYTVYRKFLPPDTDSEGGVFLLLIKIQKGILANIQVVFAGNKRWGKNPLHSGEILLRDKDNETFLEGKTLPLDRRDAVHYTKLWKAYLSGKEKPGPLLQAKILNSIEAGILELAD